MTASDRFLPPLRDEEIERYARQIIVPGIGAAGQARLCASRVTAVGNPEGVESALTYLASAGLHVLRAPGCAPVDCVVVADVEPGLVCNVAGGEPVRLASVIDRVGELAGSPVALDRRDAQPGDVARTGGSIDLQQRLCRLHAAS